jgi:putative ABC transport system substrate-binding protein
MRPNRAVNTDAPSAALRAGRGSPVTLFRYAATRRPTAINPPAAVGRCRWGEAPLGRVVSVYRRRGDPVVDRRTFIGTLASGLLASPFTSFAQLPTKLTRIGVLGNEDGPTWESFRQGLRELGYVDGRNVTMEWRWSEGMTDRMPALALELVQLKVDILVVGGGPPGARAAMRATSTIPIVLPVVGDPVGAGLVSSLARPGGNVTGLSMLNTEISSKRVELLKEILPKIKRAAVLRDPSVRSADWDATQAAARRLGLRLELLDAGRPEELPEAFETATKARAEAVIVLSSGMFASQRRRLVDLASQSRLIAVYDQRQFPDDGGLISYGPNLLDMNRRAAKYVDKILKGAKPDDLPIEQASVFELVINLKTAKALGITIPQSLLSRAELIP